MAFIFFVETPIGLLNLRSIMEAAIDDKLPFKAEAGVFGSDDFLASLGEMDFKIKNKLSFSLASLVNDYFLTGRSLFGMTVYYYILS